MSAGSAAWPPGPPLPSSTSIPGPIPSAPTLALPWLPALASASARYSFTPAGILAAARRLAGDTVPLAEETALEPLRAIEPHIRLWATCAAYVPDPTWTQLEAIRRAFPELERNLLDCRYVQRLLDWVRERHPDELPEGSDGRRLDIPDSVIAAIITEQRRADRGKPRGQTIEWRARQLLIHQLRSAIPDSRYEQLQRDFKIAVARGRARALARARSGAPFCRPPRSRPSCAPCFAGSFPCRPAEQRIRPGTERRSIRPERGLRGSST